MERRGEATTHEVLDILCRYRSNGSGEVSFLLCAVTDDDNLIEVGVGVVQLERAARRRHILVTDIRDCQGSTCRSLDLIMTVEIGDDGILGAFDAHGGTDDRLPFLIHHRSRDGLRILCQCRGSAEQECAGEQGRKIFLFHCLFD